MLPTAITLRNYRAFGGAIRLELRPVTLLFGVNNAGKSALLRALSILGDSLGPDSSGPFHLESPAARGSTFQDLRWKGIGEDDDPDVGVGFHWDNGKNPSRVEFSLTWFSEWKRLIVRRFTIWEDSDSSVLQADWKPRPRERSAAELTYELQDVSNGLVSQTRLAFEGLVPARFSDDILEAHRRILLNAAGRLRRLRNQVQWLEAARRPPERISPYPTAPRWRIKPDGRDAATVLAGSEEVLAEVSGWYEQHLARRLHLLEVPTSGFRLMLQSLERAAIDVDLRDTGEGMIQVLPVLGALALSRRQSQGGPGILAIEEPESHLHPKLQRALAKHLCELAANEATPRIVLETHSEHLLLGVQRQIVIGKLQPEEVLVYWVRQLESGQSVVEPVTLDRDARLQGNWPPEVFSDDTAVAREIILTRRERNRS